MVKYRLFISSPKTHVIQMASFDELVQIINKLNTHYEQLNQQDVSELIQEDEEMTSEQRFNLKIERVNEILEKAQSDAQQCDQAMLSLAALKATTSVSITHFKALVSKTIIDRVHELEQEYSVLIQAQKQVIANANETVCFHSVP